MIKKYNPIMFQGTGSGVGKSLMTAALCRIFRNMGIKTAPFKAQNMALNSFVTVEGGEIGRAQALQAEAAGVLPSIYMNPILLKVTGNKTSQVILMGKVYGEMAAKDYYGLKEKLWGYVTQAFDTLSKEYELIIIEGAGSPAEINLMDEDIVNMKVADYSNANVLLVGDIERGGVFASLYGTYALVGNYAKYFKGFIINKFRGDENLLTPGIKMINEKTGIPVLGVIPYMVNMTLDEEDSLATFNKQKKRSSSDDYIKITVIKLPYISNFTDTAPFLFEPDVDVVYSLSKSDILSADLIIIPGTKNTSKDLNAIREMNVHKSLETARDKDIPIIGICGGYQMLGESIKDPYRVESDCIEMKGLGFLACNTIFNETKVTAQVSGELNVAVPFMDDSEVGTLTGYEIHMGETFSKDTTFLLTKQGTYQYDDGGLNGNVLGTYMHGIFDNDSFRRSLINGLRIRKGFEPLKIKVNYRLCKEQAIDEWTDLLKSHMDIEFVKQIVNL